MKQLLQRIEEMNRMYRLPINTRPTVPEDVAERLFKFRKTLAAEVNEIDEIGVKHAQGRQDIATATDIADVLGDIIVYCLSEALKYGIPIEHVLEIIMDSNASKLGEDGLPIYDENGKFLKGPNYWKPEPHIRRLLLDLT